MFKENIIFGLRRYFKKDKVLLLFLVIGIAISISSYTLLSEHSKSEESYDLSFENINKIYRIHSKTVNTNTGSLIKEWPMIPHPVAYSIREQIPEIKKVGCIRQGGGHVTVNKSNERFYEENTMYFADPDFFSVFKIPFIYGSPELSLKNDLSLVISESYAKKYFGNKDPINQLVTVRAGFFEYTYLITGIFKDLPEQSHLKCEMFCTNKEMLSDHDPWNFDWYFTYVQLNNNSDVKNIEKKLNSILNAQIGEQLRKENQKMELSLFPVSKIHLHFNNERDMKESGNYEQLKLIKVISLFIFLFCLVNYFLISSTHYFNRLPELHLRKYLGADFSNIFFQLLIENLIPCLLGCTVGFILLACLLPIYRDTFKLFLNFNYGLIVKYSLLSIIIVIVTSIFSLFYSLIKHNNSNHISRNSNKHFYLRNISLIFQYLIVFTIFFGLIVVNSQVKYMRDIDYGFSKKNVLIFRAPPLRMTDAEKIQKVNEFINEFKTLPGIINITNTMTIPGRFYNNYSEIKRKDAKDDFNVWAYVNDTEFNFLETFKIKLIAGRNFYPEYNDNQGVIINETLRQKLNFRSPQEAIDKFIKIDNKTFKIIGIIKDNHQNYFNNKIEPWLLKMRFKCSSFIAIKFLTTPTPEALKNIKAKYENYFQGASFEPFYLEDFFNRLFKNDENLNNLFLISSIVLLILTSFGLFGISFLVISYRIKEIAIRKVLGASFIQNFFLLFKTYFFFLITSCLISAPLVFYFMRNWLNAFYYHISINYFNFLLPFLFMLIASLLIVLINIFRTGEPLKSLKTE